MFLLVNGSEAPSLRVRVTLYSELTFLVLVADEPKFDLLIYLNDKCWVVYGR